MDGHVGHFVFCAICVVFKLVLQIIVGYVGDGNICAALRLVEPIRPCSLSTLICSKWQGRPTLSKKQAALVRLLRKAEMSVDHVRRLSIRAGMVGTSLWLEPAYRFHFSCYLLIRRGRLYVGEALRVRQDLKLLLSWRNGV